MQVAMVIRFMRYAFRNKVKYTIILPSRLRPLLCAVSRNTPHTQATATCDNGEETIVGGAMTLGARISNDPVPLVLGLPMTILAAGLDKSSKSPCSTASDRNCTVVSNEAFSSGDDLFEIPVRLNGLYPPACVWR